MHRPSAFPSEAKKTHVSSREVAVERRGLEEHAVHGSDARDLPFELSRVARTPKEEGLSLIDHTRSRPRRKRRTSQAERSPLNDEASQNMPYMEVTLETCHLS
jgi:hypothetical protein